MNIYIYLIFNKQIMPQGPEVKTITDELDKLLNNKILVSMEILGGRYKNKSKNFELFQQSPS